MRHCCAAMHQIRSAALGRRVSIKEARHYRLKPHDIRRGPPLDKARGSAQWTARSRCRQHDCRSACGNPARRLRRGRHQDRDARHRRLDASLGAHEGRPFALVEGDRPQQATDHARTVEAARTGTVPRAGARCRHPYRELQARHLREMGAGLRRAVEDQSAPDHGAGLRLRSDRPVREARRLRHHRRKLLRDSVIHRLSRPAAHAARLSARRLGRRDVFRNVGDVRDLQPRSRRRQGPGDRRQPVRAAVPPGRVAGDRLRSTRHRQAAPGQPAGRGLTAQHVPDARWPLGRHLRQFAAHVRATGRGHRHAGADHRPALCRQHIALR